MVMFLHTHQRQWCAGMRVGQASACSRAQVCSCLRGVLSMLGHWLCLLEDLNKEGLYVHAVSAWGAEDV